MKKLYYLIILTVILGLVLTGCFLSNVGQVPNSEQSGISYLTKHTEGDPFFTDLIADGRDLEIDVGDVLVWNDGDTLYVKYVITDPDWCLTETHLHVAKSWEEIPQTKKNNPIPGHFEENDEHGCVPEVLYTYDLEARGWNVDTPLFIAAHAVVQKTTIAPYYASVVIDYSQGLTKGGGSVRWQRSAPEQGLAFETGKNEFNFFSLGFGGWIIVEFDCPIQNGEGNDVKIIEDTWGGNYPLEEANVYASQDGTIWTWLGKADNTDLHIIHTISEFDLGGLEWARYIKVVDITDPLPHNNSADAYDLNAVEALHDCIQEETAWGDGEEFPGKNWATYFAYEVQKVLIEEGITVPSYDPTVVESVNTLESGKNYELEVIGTWMNGASRSVDAEYISDDGWITYSDGPSWDERNLDLQVNEEFVNWGNYSGSHIYTFDFSGMGSTIRFRVFDGNPGTNTPTLSWYGDNTGSLIVNIYELP